MGFHRGFAHRPFVHRPSAHRHGGRHGGHIRHDNRRHHGKDDVGLALPWVAGGYVNGVGDPSLLAGDPDAAGPRVIYRHVCRSDTQAVPSGRGGEVPVTVTRCYLIAE
jgi:hypothetical protein